MSASGNMYSLSYWHYSTKLWWEKTLADLAVDTQSAKVFLYFCFTTNFVQVATGYINIKYSLITKLLYYTKDNLMEYLVSSFTF